MTSLRVHPEHRGIDIGGSDAATTAAITVRGLRKAFGQRAVLEHLDLDVAPGEFVALLGASGSGKSTLLRILAGLDTEADGEVWVPRQRAVVFQDPRLLPWRKVWRNVALGLPLRSSRDRAERVLEEVGLAGHANVWPATLSGGEAQRAALARALVREPELMLLDEPFGALDALTRIKMHALLAELCARHQPAVLLVTHDVDEALLLADRVIVLAGGRFTVDRTVDLVLPRSRNEPGFAACRHELLLALGVDESAEGRAR